jgi:hypothetical protein
MLEEKSTAADPMLMKVKPQNGIYLYFASEGHVQPIVYTLLLCHDK